MEEIIKDLEDTIKYFEDSQNDFQRGRVFQAKKTLEALRIHDVVGQSEQLVCPDCKLPFTKEELDAKEHCTNCGWEFAN